LWILFSDRVAAMLATDQNMFAKISLFKGWGYVVITALLLHWLIWRYTERLQKNDELLQLIGEMAKVGGWEFDAKTFQGTWTDEVAHIHDLDPGQPTNVELGVGFYLPESKKKIEEAIKEAVESGKPYDLELEMLSAEGTPKWVRTIARPVMEKGKVTRVRGILQDITERKKAEQEIENLARFPLEDPNPVMRVTDNGQLIYANPPSRRLQDLWGCEIGDFLPDDWRKLISNSAESGSSQTKDVRCNEIVYSILVAPLAGASYVNLYSRDITERMHAEDELKRSNAELEQFAYVASHDLQEPLRAIAGMVQLLQKRYQGKLDERADEYIDHAVEAAGRMRKLINDLLTYSRVVRFGKQFEMTDVEKVLDTALANLRVALQESRATVTHDPLPSLMVDETQIGQVFQNLIGNAVKFRGERPLQIHIGAREEENAWCFEVRDNGIGIESQYFERIFGVFQRLHTRRDYPGTGIGLSLCKKIVERHGGSIWVESEAGQGTSFYFTLPHRR
jgi:PAS domain S-box-containing protein